MSILDPALKTDKRPWSSTLYQSYHSHSRLEFPQSLARIRWLPDASYSLSSWLVSRENCSLSQFCLKVDCAWTLTLTLLNTGLNKTDKSIHSWWIAYFCGSKHGLKTWLQLGMAQTFFWKQCLSWKSHSRSFTLYKRFPYTTVVSHGYKQTCKCSLTQQPWKAATCSSKEDFEDLSSTMTSLTMTAQHQPGLLGI